MTRTESQYPIGAEWRFIDKSGSIGSVWLAQRNDTFEVWRWSFEFSDGSGHKFDWATNKATAVSECKGKFSSDRSMAKFKRVNQQKKV